MWLKFLYEVNEIESVRVGRLFTYIQNAARFVQRRCFRFQQRRHHKMLLFNHFFMHKAELPRSRYFPSVLSASLHKPFFFLLHFSIFYLVCFWKVMRETILNNGAHATRARYCPQSSSSSSSVAVDGLVEFHVIQILNTAEVCIFFVFVPVWFSTPIQTHIHTKHASKMTDELSFYLYFYFSFSRPLALSLFFLSFLFVFVLPFLMQLFRTFIHCKLVSVGAYVFTFYSNSDSFRPLVSFFFFSLRFVCTILFLFLFCSCCCACDFSFYELFIAEPCDTTHIGTNGKGAHMRLKFMWTAHSHGRRKK